MTSREFCYWLQGYFEIHSDQSATALTGAQTEMVRRHLALVFKHEIDPSYAGNQAELQEIHDGKNPPLHNPNLIRC